jgi:type IV pilus assembly protein PilV
MNKQTKKTSGFSLIEVLVALFVLSLGLLGLAALQTTAFRFNTQSYQRTQAVIQAYDILDRIRANPAGKNGGLYNTVAMGYLPSSPPDCLSAACTETQMANYDIFQWNTANAAMLTSGQGSISTDAAGIRSVTIQWLENDLQMTLVVEALI